MTKEKPPVSLHWEYLGEGRYTCTANTVTGEGTSSHEAMTRALLLLTAATGVEKADMDLRFE